MLAVRARPCMSHDRGGLSGNGTASCPGLGSRACDGACRCMELRVYALVRNVAQRGTRWVMERSCSGFWFMCLYALVRNVAQRGTRWVMERSCSGFWFMCPSAQRCSAGHSLGDGAILRGFGLCALVRNVAQRGTRWVMERSFGVLVYVPAGNGVTLLSGALAGRRSDPVRGRVCVVVCLQATAQHWWRGTRHQWSDPVRAALKHKIVVRALCRMPCLDTNSGM